MKYEVWEFEYGVTYLLTEASKQTIESRERYTSEGGQCVFTFRATNWKRAKARSNKFIAERRDEWLKRNSTA